MKRFEFGNASQSLQRAGSHINNIPGCFSQRATDFQACDDTYASEIAQCDAAHAQRLNNCNSIQCTSFTNCEDIQCNDFTNCNDYWKSDPRRYTCWTARGVCVAAKAVERTACWTTRGACVAAAAVARGTCIAGSVVAMEACKAAALAKSAACKTSVAAAGAGCAIGQLGAAGVDVFNAGVHAAAGIGLGIASVVTDAIERITGLNHKPEEDVLLEPTIGYTDANGYTYVEVSESWKQMCSVLPCFAALHWPGYATKVVEVTINGQAVVIQLWKGNCQKFLGLDNFPGGIGAEVGVYRRIPGRIRPTSIPFVPRQFAAFILGKISRLSDNELWWPFPELNAQIEFTLINPVTNQTFFSAGPENSYWLAKWMNYNSYTRYQRDQGNRMTPSSAVDYLLDYKINGKIYPRW